MKIRDIPVKTGILMINIVGHLPYRLLVVLGKGIGILMLKLATSRRKIAEQNFRLCFPEYTDKQRKDLLLENFKSTGIGLMETAFCWTASANKIRAIGELNGAEYLSSVLDSGKGAIVLGFHLTSLELGGNFLANHIPIAAMYRQHTNKYFEQAMCDGRLRNVTDVIEREDVRTMIRGLKGGKAVWYAADQDYGARHSLFAPFFNISAATITATSRFVKLTGVPVIPMTHYRDKKSGKLIVQLHPQLKNFSEQDELTAATEINQFLEQFLIQHPAEYLWMHRRFKTRPEGEPALYEEKSIYKIRTKLESNYKEDMEKSTLMKGTPEKPALIQLPNGNYMKFLYLSYPFQPSPAKKYAKQWQQQEQKDKHLIKLFRYPPLNAEIVYYELL